MTLAGVIILVVITLAVVVLVVSIVFSGIVIHSRRQPIVRTPEEYGMNYEEVEFKSTDGLSIRGWFIRSLIWNLLLRLPMTRMLIS